MVPKDFRLCRLNFEISRTKLELKMGEYFHRWLSVENAIARIYIRTYLQTSFLSNLLHTPDIYITLSSAKLNNNCIELLRLNWKIYFSVLRFQKYFRS